jgi:NADH:ubiquinone oxidoreductase subunit 6 (subunit J)
MKQPYLIILLILIIIIVSMYNTYMSANNNSNNNSNNQENFTPYIRQLYRPYIRNARVNVEGFVEQHSSYLHNLLRKTGML